MSLETALNRQVQPIVGNEIVLFRTPSEILTNERIIIRGNTYPLGTITSIRVQMVWYYAPFLLVRLLAVVAAILLTLSFTGVVGRDVVPGNPNLNMFVGVLLGLAVICTTWLVPTHTLKLWAASGTTDVMMRSTDAGYLRDVQARIEAAIESRQAQFSGSLPGS